jgi:predicted nucleic acid-binding protein
MMKFIYFDASALAKRYSLELGTEQVDGIFVLIPKKRMTCAGINVGEVVSILVRKHNDGRFNDSDFAIALAEFRREIIEDPDFVYLSIDNTDIEASLKYIQQYNLNATDGLILHSAFELYLMLRASDHELILITSDRRLINAARSLSLPYLNPEIETLNDIETLLKE